ncbi:MAG: DUF429 domain-containing protein [Thermoplasmata archaeon]|nr:DUF429 domain-containing protein [Thermoplasmata archaeon]
MRSAAAVVGLDLAGSPRRSTGVCVLTGDGTARMSVAGDDTVILAVCRPLRAGVVVIDAPLSLPRGRRSLEDRTGPHLRVCDRELLKRGIRFFPLTLGPMRMLTARGMELAERLRNEGWTVIEGYPGGAQDVWGIPRKGTDLEGLRRGLVGVGLRFRPAASTLTHDELDAACCALVGRQHTRGEAEALGDPTEGLLYLPGPGRPFVSRRLRRPHRATMASRRGSN